MATTSYQWRAGPVALAQMNDALIAGDQNQVAVASNVSGLFFGAWTDPTAGDSVEGRVMFGNGNPIASQFTVNIPSAASQREASMAGLLDGRYVVAFTDTSIDPGGDITRASSTPTARRLEVNSPLASTAPTRAKPMLPRFTTGDLS